MKISIELAAEFRTDEGKGASRRLRHAGRVPAILYGGQATPRMLSFNHQKLLTLIDNEKFYASIIGIKVGDTTEAAVVKDLQMHPAKNQVLHLDFQRVLEDEKIRVHLPIHFKVIATDFDAMEERVIESGSLVKAVGASIAIPGVILGTQYDGHSYVDGCVTNPVPFNRVREGMDIVIAVDVSGRPREANGKNRSNMELAVGSLLILFNQVASLRREISPPDIYVRPALDSFSGGDFFRIKEVIEQAQPAKDQLKRELEKRLTAITNGGT